MFAVLLLFVAIFVFIFVYRRYYRPKGDTIRRSPPTTGITTIPDNEEGNIYEETEYQSVPERSGSNSSDTSQQHQQKTYEDLKGSSFKTHISQSSRFSSTKSNTYQGLIGGTTDKSTNNDSDDDDNIYAYIDEQATADDNNHLKPGTSFNLFKRSLEDLKQDSSNLEKNNFSSYVTVTEKTLNNNSAETIELATATATPPHIYKTPSSVPKFNPPRNSTNENEVKGIYEVDVRAISADGSGSPLYEDILHS